MELSILTHQHCSELVSHSLLNLFAKSWASFQKNEAMAHRRGVGVDYNLEPACSVNILLQGGRALGPVRPISTAGEHAHPQGPVKFGRSTVGLRNLHF